MSDDKNKYESKRWLKQAESELLAAKASVNNYAFNACFLSQQSAEKALKSYLYLKGERGILSHSNLSLIKKCAEIDKAFEILKRNAKELDSYYLSTRYPDSLPDGVPCEVYEKEDAVSAVSAAEKIIYFVKEKIKQKN
ncbi:MAG: HEPN domain-containing protein [archaeon]